MSDKKRKSSRATKVPVAAKAAKPEAAQKAAAPIVGYLVDPDGAVKILDYLTKRPYGEVSDLIAHLTGARPVSG